MKKFNNNKIILLSIIILIIWIGIGIFVSYLINKDKNKFQWVQIIENQTTENVNSSNQADDEFKRKEKCFNYQKNVCEYLSTWRGTLGWCETFYSKKLNTCLVYWEWSEWYSDITRYTISDFLQGYKDIYYCWEIESENDWHFTDSNWQSWHNILPTCPIKTNDKKKNLINEY